jgi:hypothetical protein
MDQEHLDPARFRIGIPKAARATVSPNASIPSRIILNEISFFKYAASRRAGG